MINSNHRLTDSPIHPFGDIYKGKRVLVTGHTGFKGCWLSCWLKQLGAEVCGVSKDVPTNPSMFESIALNENISHNIADVRNLDGIRTLIEDFKPDFVFHLAAQSIVSRSYREPLETITTNVVGTAVILEALREYGDDCCAVIITSDKCYDNVEWIWGYREGDHLGGKDMYSGSKGAAELIFKSYYHSFFAGSKVRVATARAGNVIGGGDWAPNRIIPDCVRAWSAGEKVILRSPDATRPWQHVLEPLSGYLAIAAGLRADVKLSGESFNFGPCAEYNFTVEKIVSDLADAWAGCPGYDVEREKYFHEAGLLKLNCDKALHMLKWVPILSYDEMIHFVAHWYTAYCEDVSTLREHTIQQISDYQNKAGKRGVAWAH